MYVIEKKIEIFFCRVDTAWRIIEQDTSSSYTDLECLGLVMPYIPCVSEIGFIRKGQQL